MMGHTMHISERMNAQKNEFDAFVELRNAYAMFEVVAIVDDDYPEVRHVYERKLQAFLTACGKNGRTIPA